MEVEYLAAGVSTASAFEIAFDDCHGLCRVDWEPMVHQLLGLSVQGKSGPLLSAMFHNTLVEIIVHLALYAGQQRVVLTGGCFQNKILCEAAIRRLTIEGFKPYWHQRVPPNDGGIALGQIYAGVRAGSAERIRVRSVEEEVAA